MLIVDDDEMLLRLLVRQLGVAFDVIADGDSRVARARVLAGERFDAILSDRRMPGVDGPTLLGEARSRAPGMARILLSGDTSPEEVRADPNLVDVWLAKPASPEDLVEAVRTAMRRAQHRREAGPSSFDGEGSPH